jgi:hypothetical protein
VLAGVVVAGVLFAGVAVLVVVGVVEVTPLIWADAGILTPRIFWVVVFAADAPVGTAAASATSVHASTAHERPRARVRVKPTLTASILTAVMLTVTRDYRACLG